MAQKMTKVALSTQFQVEWAMMELSTPNTTGQMVLKAAHVWLTGAAVRVTTVMVPVM